MFSHFRAFQGRASLPAIHHILEGSKIRTSPAANGTPNRAQAVVRWPLFPKNLKITISTWIKSMNTYT
jgi:hypothetical protein